jgi:hypothetical protein
MAGNLKNLSFKSATATILSVEHISRVLVEWELEKTAQNIRGLVFFVDRGESPEEMHQLHTDAIPTSAKREFVDYTANLLDLHKVYYYRVRAVEIIAGAAVQTFTSPLFTWTGSLDLVGLYVVEEHLFLYRYTSAGTPCLIFQKRHDGERCTNCFDPVLKRVTSSSCTVCFGTGVTGGYYPPIDAWVGFEPDPKVVQVADWGLRQANQTDLRFTNHPVLRVDDVLYEAQTHKFWNLTQVSSAEKNRATTLQFARGDAVNRSDIEYKLDLPEERCLAMLALLEERRKETEF